MDRSADPLLCLEEPTAPVAPERGAFRDLLRVAVIGGGWYGCHIACTLRAQQAHVLLLEKEDRLFSEASGNNQFRLHLGLHYPRSAVTRHQSRDGFSRFSERYPRFSQAIERNIYVIPRDSSLVDFDTYFSIMYSSGIRIEKYPVEALDFLRRDQIAGALTCDERVVRTSAARTWFRDALGDCAQTGQTVDRIECIDSRPVVLGEAYDYVVDATWGNLAPPSREFYFEPTLLLYYRYQGLDRFPAITLVDGDLWSIYPSEHEGVYTLSSVVHTPLGRFGTKAEAYGCLASVDEATILARRAAMQAQVCEHFPEFPDRFEYLGPQLAIKTKPVGRADDRSVSIRREANVFRVNSGKIDTIFYAGDAVVGAIYHGG